VYGIDVVFSSSRQSRCDVRASDGIFGCVCGVLVAEAVGYRGNKQRDLVMSLRVSSLGVGVHSMSTWSVHVSCEFRNAGLDTSDT